VNTRWQPGRMVFRKPLAQTFIAAVLLLTAPDCRVAADNSHSKLPVTVPVEIAANLVYLHGRINGSPPLNVVLDTGSSVSIVAPGIAKQIGLHPSGSGEAAGIGHGRSEAITFVQGVRLQIDDSPSVELNDQTIAILPINYVAEEVGRPTDSFFGSNIFKNYRVTVDYASERVTFAAPQSVQPADSGTPLPIQIMSDTPFVTATLVGSDGSRVQGLFLLDSGTTGSLILSTRFLAAHPQIVAGGPQLTVPSINAVGGKIELKLVRIVGVDLGPFHFHQPVAIVPQSAAGMLANPQVAGFIGAEILRRFTVTWDYPHNRISLAPNAHLHDPFEGDASGLRLTVSPPDYQDIQVVALLPGSPAAQSGLRVGDVIIGINGHTGMPLWRVVDDLRKPNTSPELTVRRDNKTFHVRLSLRRLV
jgi:hypothetical protein